MINDRISLYCSFKITLRIPNSTISRRVLLITTCSFDGYDSVLQTNSIFLIEIVPFLRLEIEKYFILIKTLLFLCRDNSFFLFLTELKKKILLLFFIYLDVKNLFLMFYQNDEVIS